MKRAGRRGRGVEEKLSMKVASAGQWVNSASSAIAGSSSSQPWMVAVRREVMRAHHPHPLVPAKAGTQGQQTRCESKASIRYLFIQVAPAWIRVLNQFKFPSPIPFLDLSLAHESRLS